MASYLTPCTASSPGVLRNLPGNCITSLEFVNRIRAVSPNISVFVQLKKPVPEPVGGRYSFRELFSSLDNVEQKAAAEERAAFDTSLRDRLARDEISPLYYYRCLARMTQEQLATKSDSRQSFLSQVEKRKRTLTWKQAEKFAAALDVEPEQLMEKRTKR